MELFEIRSKVQHTIDKLPPAKLHTALMLLEKLLMKEDEETRTLMEEFGFMEDYCQGKEDICKGRTIRWEDIRRDKKR